MYRPIYVIMIVADVLWPILLLKSIHVLQNDHWISMAVKRGLIASVEKATALQWRHTGRDGVSNHQPPDCLLIRLFRRRSKKISKLRVTGLCAGNSPVTDEFSAQKASNVEMFPLDDVIMGAYPIISNHRTDSAHSMESPNLFVQYP